MHSLHNKDRQPLTQRNLLLAFFLTADICTSWRKMKGISLPCGLSEIFGDDGEAGLISFVSYSTDNGGLCGVLKARQPG